MNNLILIVIFICFSCSVLTKEFTYLCSDYIKLQQELNCSENHYLKNFAYKYCNRYQKHEASYSPQGQEWIKDVRQCLLTHLLESNEIFSCNSIAKAAYADHIVCYIKHGFCHLDFKDQRMALLHAWDSLYYLEVWKSILDISRTCKEI